MRTSLPVYRVGLAILLLVIWVGPFFQGYFFSTPTLVAMAATAGAFGLWAIGRRRQRHALDLPGDWTGTLLLALTVWCLLATLWAVYVRDHLTLVLQVATAFAAFALVRAENTVEVRRVMVWLLSSSALLVAILGLLEYGGFFMEHLALANLLQIEPQRDRLYTVFQYPNSAAVFFLAVLILHNARLIVSESWTEKIVLTVSSAVIAIGFALTLSRGALLVAPVSVVFLWLGLELRQILRSLLHWVTTVGLPVAVTLRPITQAASADAWTTVLLWALIAVLVGTVATAGLQATLRLSRRVQIAAGWILLVLFVAGGIFAAPRVLNQMPSVFARAAEMSIEDFTTDGRYEFLRDAGTLAVRRPWGYGGGGWLRTYTHVQRYNYVARDPHSLYALSLVESGVPGLALLLGTIGLATYHAFRIRKSDPVRWAMAAAALTLAGHAAIDIDLSYYGLWLLFWALLGAAQPEPQQRPIKHEHRMAFPIAMTSATAVLFLCSTFLVAARSFRDAQVAALLGNKDRAIAAATRAIRLDPLNSQYRTMIPTAENINRALQLDPLNEQLWRFVSVVLEEQGDIVGALTAAQRALQLRPMSVSHYERVTELSLHMMMTALEEDRSGDAVAIAKEIIQLGHSMEQRGKPSLVRQQLLFPTYAALTWTPRLNLAVGAAHFVVGEYEVAESRLTEALTSEDTADDAALWLHALYTRTGDQEGLATLQPAPTPYALNSRLYAALVALQ